MNYIDSNLLTEDIGRGGVDKNGLVQCVQVKIISHSR